MDIQCDRCGTSYVFDESRATGERMRFKCSKCGNVFDAEITVPKVVEEDLSMPEETIRIDMHERLEQIVADQKYKEEVEQEYKEEDHAIPERGPIRIEGVIGADEAGLNGDELPDIAIGEPPSRLSTDSRISRRGRGIVWRLAPSILISVLLIAAILFGIYLTGSTLAPDLTAIIPHSIQRFFTKTQESSVKNLALIGVEGFFSRNNLVGHIYVVKGRVENHGDKPYKNIRVKGILYNKEGIPLMETEVLCGIDISDRDLATLSENEIYARMTRLPPEGGGILQPSKTIPYTVVFIDLPKDIYEYSIRIISADSTA